MYSSTKRHDSSQDSLIKIKNLPLPANTLFKVALPKFEAPKESCGLVYI
jgi:hypothetical protein